MLYEGGESVQLVADIVERARPHSGDATEILAGPTVWSELDVFSWWPGYPDGVLLTLSENCTPNTAISNRHRLGLGILLSGRSARSALRTSPEVHHLVRA